MLKIRVNAMMVYNFVHHNFFSSPLNIILMLKCQNREFGMFKCKIFYRIDPIFQAIKHCVL